MGGGVPARPARPLCNFGVFVNMIWWIFGRAVSSGIFYIYNYMYTIFGLGEVGSGGVGGRGERKLQDMKIYMR